MGAIAAVLLSSRAKQHPHSVPLTIASDKSGVGHTEPAAGMSGLVHAAAAAAGQAALPVLHLRALNPYLIGTLEAPGIAGTVSVPRQQRGAVLGQQAAGSITGISSFAFQVGWQENVVRLDAFGAAASAHSNEAWRTLPKPKLS